MWITSLFVNPLVSVALTAAVFFILLRCTRRVALPSSIQHAPAALHLARTARRFGATSGALTLAVFIGVYGALFAGFAEPWAYLWWEYPLALLLSVAALVVITGVLASRRVAPAAPVVPVERRDWWSFSRRSDLIFGACVALVSVLTCVIAGSNSDWMTIAFPSGGGYSTFFGWAYGLPVLIGTLLLVALTIAALMTSARPPFVSPETVEAESIARRMMAKSLVRAAIAAVLVPLGLALQTIGGAASSRSGFGIPGVGDYMFNLGFSSLAEPLLVAGRLCEMAAVIIVFFLFVGGDREWRFTKRTTRPASTEGAQ